MTDGFPDGPVEPDARTKAQADMQAAAHGLGLRLAAQIVEIAETYAAAETALLKAEHEQETETLEAAFEEERSQW